MDFNEIVKEVEFRSGEIVDFKSPKQISILSEVLTDFGYGKVKNQFLRNLLEGPNDGDNAKSSKEVEDEKAKTKGYTSIGGAFYVKNADAEKRPGNDGGSQAKNDDSQRYVLDKDSGNFKPTEDNSEKPGIEPKDLEKSKEGGEENSEDGDEAAEAEAEVQANIKQTFDDPHYQKQIKDEEEAAREDDNEKTKH